MFGHPLPCTPSRFVKEIPEDCMDKKVELPKEVFQRPKKQSLSDRRILSDVVTSVPQRVAPPSTKVNYNEGMRIRHKVFGDGTVTGVTPMASDCMLTVRFDTVGEKKLMTNYVKLEIL